MLSSSWDIVEWLSPCIAAPMASGVRREADMTIKPPWWVSLEDMIDRCVLAEATCEKDRILAQKRNENAHQFAPVLWTVDHPPAGQEYPGQRSRSRPTEPSRGKTNDLPRTRLMGIVGIKIRPSVIG